jgi:hypothetical protein
MPEVKGLTPGQLIERTAELIAQPTPEEIIADAEAWVAREWVYRSDPEGAMHDLIQHLRDRWLMSEPTK